MANAIAKTQITGITLELTQEEAEQLMELVGASGGGTEVHGVYAIYDALSDCPFLRHGQYKVNLDKGYATLNRTKING